MGFFDAPVDPNDTYGVNTAARQRKVAESLRKMTGNMPQGQMVGKHYVAPSWTQYLAPLAGSVGGAFADTAADKSEAASKASIADATNKWIAATPATQPAQVMPGETKEGLYGPETFAPHELTPEVPVTGPQVLKHALEGRRIPGNEENAKMYQTGAMADLSREDNQREALRKQLLDQQLKRETTEKELVAKREALEKELAGKAATDASRAETARMIDATNRLIAAGQREGAMERAQLRAQTANDKPVNPTVVDKLNKGYEKLSTIQQLAGEYQPEFSGVKGAAADWAGKLPLVNTRSNEWWKNYKRESALIERHGLFGSALTPAELASWKEADISSDMDSTKVADNLQRRQMIMRKHFKDQEGAYERGGHKVAGMFDLGPEPTPVAGSTAAAAAATPPAPTAIPAGTKKMIGNKQYVNNGGGPNDWHVVP